MSSLGLWHDPEGMSRSRERYENSKKFLALPGREKLPDYKFLEKQNRRVVREYEAMEIQKEATRVCIQNEEDRVKRGEPSSYSIARGKSGGSESWLTRD